VESLFFRQKYDGESNQEVLRQLYLYSPFDSSITESLYSPKGDGQCGFRSLAMSLFGDQNKWIEVKKEMFNTFLNYQSSLGNFRFPDQEKFKNILSCYSSPCPPEMYFDFIDCPQIAADAFGRIVAVYSVNREHTGQLSYASSLFLPLIRLPSSSTVINLFLYNYHFYLIDPFRAENGSTVNYTLPLVNPYHTPILKRCPELLQFDLSSNFNTNT
jgi:hypothetical protein